jgi:SAM-dependent methyltransferase
LTFADDTGTQRDDVPRVPDQWYVDFHRGLAADFWRAAGAAMVDDDMRVVRRVLEAEEVASVLDVPCGDGRITIRLAAAGSRAIGVDIAAGEVEHARRAAAAAGVRADFAVGDLSALPDVGPVDAVLSWGNSFGYLTPGDTARSLTGMHRALRSSGRLVLESMTVAESLLVGGVRPAGEYAFGGVRMTLVNRYRPAESRLEAEVVLEDADGRVERGRIAHHVHTTGEIVRMLHGAGFRDVVLLGPDGVRAYELGAPRLIAVATA